MRCCRLSSRSQPGLISGVTLGRGGGVAFGVAYDFPGGAGYALKDGFGLGLDEVGQAGSVPGFAEDASQVGGSFLKSGARLGR